MTKDNKQHNDEVDNLEGPMQAAFSRLKDDGSDTKRSLSSLDDAKDDKDVESKSSEDVGNVSNSSNSSSIENTLDLSGSEIKIVKSALKSNSEEGESEGDNLTDEDGKNSDMGKFLNGEDPGFARVDTNSRSDKSEDKGSKVTDEEVSFINNLYSDSESLELKSLTDEQKAELILKNPEKYGVDTSTLSNRIGRSALSILGTMTGTRVFYEGGKLLKDISKKKEQRSELTDEVFNLLENFRRRTKRAIGSEKNYSDNDMTDDEKEVFKDIDLDSVELRYGSMVVLDKFKSINSKLREIDMPPEEKMALRQEMANILREYRREKRDLMEVKEKKMKDLTDLYINNKAQAMLVGKEAFNTAALVATSPLGGLVAPMLRSAGFLMASTLERVRNSIEKYNKLHFRMGDGSVVDKTLVALKSTFIDSVKETYNALTLKGGEKIGGIQKSAAFVSSVASVLRLSGIVGVDLFIDKLKAGESVKPDNLNVKLETSYDLELWKSRVEEVIGGQKSDMAGLGVESFGGKANIDDVGNISEASLNDFYSVAKSVGVDQDKILLFHKIVLSDSDFIKNFNLILSDVRDNPEILKSLNTEDEIRSFLSREVEVNVSHDLGGDTSYGVVEDSAELERSSYRVEAGDNLWDIIANVNGIRDLEGGRKDNAIANVLSVLKSDKELLTKLGLDDGDINNLKLGQELDLSVIDSILNEEKIGNKGILEHAEALDDRVVSSIEKNNAKIEEFYNEINRLRQDNPSIELPRLDEDMADKIIRGEISASDFVSSDERVESGDTQNNLSPENNIDVLNKEVDLIVERKINDIYKVKFLGIPMGSQIEEWEGVPEKGIMGVKHMYVSDIFKGEFESFSGEKLDFAELKNRDELLAYLNDLKDKSGIDPRSSETTEEYIKRAEKAILLKDISHGEPIKLKDGIEIKTPPKIRIKG